MLQNCTITKKNFGEACPRTFLANAWQRHASQAPPKKKNSCPPPLANPAYAHELLLRNLFENPPWQTVDCVYYVICLCNMHYKIFLGGQKMTKIVAQHILKCMTWALFSNTMCP